MNNDAHTFRLAGKLLANNMTSREVRMAQNFFGGPAASVTAKGHLRSLLAASDNAELVATLRTYFNTIREDGDRITAADVSSAIRLLQP